MVANTLYHGTCGIAAQEIIRTFELRPLVKQRVMSRRGYGPYGDPHCVYLSDAFAISYAMHGNVDSLDDTEALRCVVEVDLPDWVRYFSFESGNRWTPLIIPDQTYFILKTFRQIDWHSSHDIRDNLCPIAEKLSNKYPGRYSARASYEEMGSVGVFLGMEDCLPYLPVKRVAIFQDDSIAMDNLVMFNSIDPQIYEPVVLAELREIHEALFNGEFDGVEVIDSATHRAPIPYRTKIATLTL